jgi:ATP-dependent Clp protease adaptor protein ClpS
MAGSSNENDTNGTDTESRLRVRTKPRVDEPKMYKVFIHNDHYTTMDFVVEVLVSVFQKTSAEATQLMLDVHKKGAGLCGVFTYDVAQTKVDRVHAMARERQFPLKCSCEPDA